MLFIIGCGRSGTHWLGNTLQQHAEISVSMEATPIFQMVTLMALDPFHKKYLYPLLALAYRFNHARVAPRWYADKSHPNLWLAEDLSTSFTAARFVGIERNPYAVVASMLRHEGVRKWFRNWRKYGIPNRFLGITQSNASIYAELPLVVKCALRWRAHHQRMNAVKKLLKDKLWIVNYERFSQDTAAELFKLAQFLKLPTPIPTPWVKKPSLTRWRDELTAQECNQITAAIQRNDRSQQNQPNP